MPRLSPSGALILRTAAPWYQPNSPFRPDCREFVIRNPGNTAERGMPLTWIDDKVRDRAANHGTTRRAFRAAMAMVAIVPALNSRASASMPSEKMTPFSGVIDSITMTAPTSRAPKTRPAWLVRLTNGSRTAHSNCGESQFSFGGSMAFMSRPIAIPEAMLNTDDIQPVDPAP